MADLTHPIDIAELRRLHEAATDAPWQAQSPSPYPEDNGICVIGLRLNDDGTPLETPTNGLVVVATQSPVEADEGDFERATANADLVTALRNALPALIDRIEAEEWRSIETAPYSQEVIVRAGSMTFRAMLVPNASINEHGMDCDQWQATIEGEHPPCWSGGACWESNEDEVMSLQPDAWRPAPTTGGADA